MSVYIVASVIVSVITVAAKYFVIIIVYIKIIVHIFILLLFIYLIYPYFSVIVVVSKLLVFIIKFEHLYDLHLEQPCTFLYGK